MNWWGSESKDIIPARLHKAAIEVQKLYEEMKRISRIEASRHLTDKRLDLNFCPHCGAQLKASND